MPVRDATNQSERILSLWQGSWIAALAVGALTWGLILWPVIAFRRKRGATGLPPQTRYNLPIEVLYTAVPLIMIAVFFYFTARDEDRIMQRLGEPRPHDHGHRLPVVLAVHLRQRRRPGHHDVTGTPGKPPDALPARRARACSSSCTPTTSSTRSGCPRSCSRWTSSRARPTSSRSRRRRSGTFTGKCAELCGLDHARMLFNVKVVTPTEYQAYVSDQQDRRARAGSAQ